MPISSSGSVRVDLVGGTLDIEPINLIIPNVCTLNVATSLKAEIKLEKLSSPEIKIHSLDYDQNYLYDLKDLKAENFYDDQFFKEMIFIVQIIDYFKIDFGLQLTLSSGAPAGSGLGGSSAMAVTLFKGMLELTHRTMDVHKIVSIVKNIEGKILNKGMPGYQDYFPALTGGILALRGTNDGIVYEQMYDPGLKDYLEKNFLLVFSGITRNSGINNWEVYKGFFDQDPKVRSGLTQIASISYKVYNSIKNKEYSELVNLISMEGEIREKLFSNIVPVQIKNLMSDLKKQNLSSGFKMCGAGGGGCFLIAGTDHEKIKEVVSQYQMKVLDFKIDGPI